MFGPNASPDYVPGKLRGTVRGKQIVAQLSGPLVQ